MTIGLDIWSEIELKMIGEMVKKTEARIKWITSVILEITKNADRSPL